MLQNQQSMLVCIPVTAKSLLCKVSAAVPWSNWKTERCRQRHRALGAMLCIHQPGPGWVQLLCSSSSRHGFSEPRGCLVFKSTFRWDLTKSLGAVFLSLSLSDVLCPFSWLGLRCSHINCFCIFGTELIISWDLWCSHRELRPAWSLLRSSTPGASCEQKLGALVLCPLAPCAKRLLRLQRWIVVEPRRVWQGLRIWAQSCTKAAPAVPGEELAPEARALHPRGAAFCSNPGPELFLFVCVDNPQHLCVLCTEMQWYF